MKRREVIASQSAAREARRKLIVETRQQIVACLSGSDVIQMPPTAVDALRGAELLLHLAGRACEELSWLPSIDPHFDDEGRVS